MDFEGKNIVITGAGSGIGASIARAAAAKGGKVIVSDINLAAAKTVAAEIGGAANACDVADENQVKELVAFAEAIHGPVDLFCSNAGLAFGEESHAASASNQVWETCWQVHVMAHVYASRAVLPSMIARRQGYLVNVASAAGLLNQIGDAAYSTTKHAAVGLAESLAITHGADNIKVSVVCPQYVATPLLGYEERGAANEAAGIISAEQVADTVISGIEQEKFLILTHPEVHEFMQHRAADTDRWISGMQRLRDKIIAAAGSTRLEDMHKMFKR
jgi:NAD(P)-dependent dehydrogenase (short-subunit alcohol dehydrogenase family)